MMTSSGVDTTIGALLAVLDEDIQHLERSLSGLDTLRKLLIKRDDAALDDLLSEIRRQAEGHSGNERKREDLRADLARFLGCDVSGMTLSRLQAGLSGPMQAAVADRQTRLKSLIVELKKEYALTAVLLSDCARFNRSLMRVFFGREARGGLTYSASGAARHQTNAALVSLHL